MATKRYTSAQPEIFEGMTPRQVCTLLESVCERLSSTNAEHAAILKEIQRLTRLFVDKTYTLLIDKEAALKFRNDTQTYQEVLKLLEKIGHANLGNRSEYAIALLQNEKKIGFVVDNAQELLLTIENPDDLRLSNRYLTLDACKPKAIANYLAIASSQIKMTYNSKRNAAADSLIREIADAVSKLRMKPYFDYEGENGNGQFGMFKSTSEFINDEPMLNKVKGIVDEMARLSKGGKGFHGHVSEPMLAMAEKGQEMLNSLQEIKQSMVGAQEAISAESVPA